MTDAPLLLGLHITKCAGTSLISTLRRVLCDDEYYFFSSYHEIWRASRPCLAEIVDRDRLRIVFGHYCHESLLSVFADRSICLFTGLREPLTRAVSGYRQNDSVRATAGQDPIPAEVWLADHVNPMCGEILRCFPGIAARAGATWQRARTALSLFDFIYETERFARDAVTLCEIMGIETPALVSDNISGARAMPPDRAAYLDEQCLVIRERDREFLGEDMRLWEVMRPWLGQPWLRPHIARERWAVDRPRYIKTLAAPEEALATFAAREHDFFLHEFERLGRLPALKMSLAGRIASAQSMFDRITIWT